MVGGLAQPREGASSTSEGGAAGVRVALVCVRRRRKAIGGKLRASRPMDCDVDD